ncbi:Uu.00g051210.m01.CDS01 [Anthostomella pinea]|uniref:Uu.00g051210.m01.CDS01 n=1 Tax=Anthostomella pinea TaxID=933095 RepID=A0AAI8VSU8_9PEZI|nr:Uu.00g051210.m01.CDS01 [Anthostomella pinea]
MPSAINRTVSNGGTSKIRMMVLETDDPHPETHDEKGSYSEILHRHFVEAGKSHNPPLGVETDRRFVVRDKGGKVPKFEDFEGVHSVLITGSMFDAEGDNPWIIELLDLLRDLYKQRPDCKLSGVCFGHQLICRLLGATVGPSPAGDWELGHSPINLTPVGQQIFKTSSGRVHLHQMHQGQVNSAPTAQSAGDLLPPDAKVHIWGWSEHTPVQGVYIADRVLTTQAHLAFDEQMVRREIDMRVESGGIQDLAHADRAKETAHLEHDGLKVAAAILRFFHDEDRGIYEKMG